MKNKIAKYTKNIRYNLISKILKVLTPKLFETIHSQTFKASSNSIIMNKDIIPIPIRPSIKFMKNYFNNKPLTGLELGVKRGNNAKSILSNLNIKKLFLIDAWLNYYYIPKNNILNYKYVQQLFKNNSKIEIIKGKSLDIQKNFNILLDFIYIDSDHSYKAIYNDIFYWSNNIRKGGIIAGHDIRINSKDTIDNPNGFCVYPAVNDYCTDFNYTYYIYPPDWWFIKN